mgnify:CR=1 FL=1
MRVVTKSLSANDTGETGGHQAGILVPKVPELLAFFPALPAGVKNPRHHILVTDEMNVEWEFSFIYYNNRFFGGTRNEYRLTRMTKYLRNVDAVQGDDLEFSKSDAGEFSVALKKASNISQDRPGVLKLGSGWRVIPL